MNQLSAWTTFKESTQFMFSNLKTFGKIWLSVLLLTAGLSLIVMLLSLLVAFFSLSETVGIFVNGLILIPQLLISVYISSTLGSRWIQFYNAPGKIKWFQFKKAERQFFKYSLLIMGVALGVFTVAAIPIWLLVNLLIFPLYNDHQVLSIILCILMGLITLAGFLFLSIRLSFVWPAAALLRPTSLKESWRQTRPYQKQLFYFGGLLLLIIASPLILFPLGTFFSILAIVLCIICGTLFGGVSYIGLTKFYKMSQE